MNANPNPNVPFMGPGYMPYSYASGIFQNYGRHERSGTSDPAYRSAAAPDFSTPPQHRRQLDHPQTVEQVIASGYFAIPNSDPETAIISDKRDVSKLGLDDVISQVRNRFDLYQQNMYELSQSMCEAKNSVFRQEAAQGKPADNRQIYSEQKQIQKLYEQERMERVNLWRDVSRLRLALPETVQSYLGAYRKLSILNEPTGDLL